MYKYELVVMGFLHDRPMHGYQIKREVQTYRMDSWANISHPLLYLTITKLEKNGMVKNSKVERVGLMPERRIYRLTPKGKEHLGRLVEKSLMEKNLTYDLSNLGYFFITALPKERALECLNLRKTLLERIIQSLKKRLADFKGKTPINRYAIIEKDLHRFKSELARLKTFAKSVNSHRDWAGDTSA